MEQMVKEVVMVVGVGLDRGVDKGQRAESVRMM